MEEVNTVATASVVVVGEAGGEGEIERGNWEGNGGRSVEARGLCAATVEGRTQRQRRSGAVGMGAQC